MHIETQSLQADTEFINGLGIEFKDLPYATYSGYEMHKMFNFGLGYFKRKPDIRNVRIPSTLEHRKLTFMEEEEYRDDDCTPSLIGLRGAVFEVLNDDDTDLPDFRKLFSVVMARPVRTASWQPLRYFDSENGELEDARDQDVAEAIFRALIRRPSKRQFKSAIKYLSAPV